MYKFSAFSLQIESEIFFPELLAGDDTSSIFIKYGSVSQEGLSINCHFKDLYYHVSEGEFWLHIPNVARFLVSQGNTIVVDPICVRDEDSIRVFILGSCMGALLMQRKLFLLHGNAVKINNHCISFVGDTGVGKSTLSGAFLKRGYSILADDVCAIDELGNVVPSFPQIKLWHDAVQKLSIDVTRLRRIRPSIEKFAVPLESFFYKDALPLKIVCVLNKHDSDEITFEYIFGMQKINPIYANIYRRNYIQGLDDPQRVLKQCLGIASNIHVLNIYRPNNGCDLDLLVDLIQHNLGNYFTTE